MTTTTTTHQAIADQLNATLARERRTVRGAAALDRDHALEWAIDDHGDFLRALKSDLGSAESAMSFAVSADEIADWPVTPRGGLCFTSAHELWLDDHGRSVAADAIGAR